MLIKKAYRFYYAHRNQELIDSPCFRIHGHDANLYVHFEVERKGNITTLFDDFDKKIEPFLKKEIDHRTLIDVNDPLNETFKQHFERTGEDLGAKILPFPTSAENLCFYFFSIFTFKFGFKIEKIEFQETRSSTVIYSKEDFDKDVKSNLGKNFVQHLYSNNQA